MLGILRTRIRRTASHLKGRDRDARWIAGMAVTVAVTVAVGSSGIIARSHLAGHSLMLIS
jgi:hypothetical protein